MFLHSCFTVATRLGPTRTPSGRIECMFRKIVDRLRGHSPAPARPNEPIPTPKERPKEQSPRVDGDGTLRRRRRRPRKKTSGVSDPSANQQEITTPPTDPEAKTNNPVSRPPHRRPSGGSERSGNGAHTVRGRSCAAGQKTPFSPTMAESGLFGNIKVTTAIARALTDMGYNEPTPIQAMVLLPMLDGLDVVGQAQTGTGKTAGFGIPMLQSVEEDRRYVQALVLVPTRELARQVADELTRIAKYRRIEIAAVYGGAAIGPQLKSLARGAQVVVGTPGRVLDHLSRRSLQLDGVNLVVLDEADQMLDIGFLPDIRRILRTVPTSRQTGLFTATVPTSIKRLIYSYLNDPEWIIAGGESKPVDEVEQICYEVASRDKPEAMVEVIEKHPGEQTLIFCRTQVAVDRVVRILQRKGHAIVGIHGAMPQRERDAVMARFRAGDAKLLVSTNLTARGIDVPTVENVVNYDIPESVEEYVHRIGRTARMGRPGMAITFVSEWDFDFLEAIKKHVGIDQIKARRLSIYG